MPASSTPRALWAKRICAASRKTVAAMIQTGRLLIAAKAKLKHGEFIAMLRSDLPFKERVAQHLMKIARNPAISKASNWSHLPVARSTLSDLAAKNRQPQSCVRRDQSRHDAGAASNRNPTRAAFDAANKRGNSRGHLAQHQESRCRSGEGPPRNQFRPGGNRARFACGQVGRRFQGRA